MKKNPRMILVIISLILVAQLIFVYSKANDDRPSEMQNIKLNQQQEKTDLQEDL